MTHGTVMAMSTLLVTPSVSDSEIVSFIREKLASGQSVQVMASEPFLTPEEAAHQLGVSRAFIMNKIKEGTITSTKKGTRHRTAVTEVERFRQWYLHDLVEFSAADALDDLFGGDQ